MRYHGPAVAGRQAHRDHLSADPRVDSLQRHGVTAQIVAFSGAVEIAPSLGKADLICDLVSSGATLRAHQLRSGNDSREPCGVDSDAGADSRPRSRSGCSACCMRIQGVLQVKESKYIMLHAPRSALKQIRALLPGSESPDDHSARRSPTTTGRLHAAVPRERVLGNARGPERSRRQLDARVAGREDAGVTTMRVAVWQRSRADRRAPCRRAPRSRNDAAFARAWPRSSRVRREGDAALLELTARFDRVR